ncbi:Rieske (2Fe-2S) protein [Aspergillus mulundensis]|uniref:Rieske domain-containing protein n=1 Tax=Aspergillus mulundensis TaxID=1810919 RepID=A0A3D8SLA0_9EURO|nr:hypothetical protein DSM5745_03698 [Aspergillus mulundensis]RDW87056.1 hypothetical protein DSM5745_03698 [Aspergillus mulundensis]
MFSNPFFRSAKADAAWHRVGLLSEFPEISPDSDCTVTASCKAFRIPAGTTNKPEETDIDLPGDLKDQVLVFRYKGNVHAIDHGSLFDIEDFGITLSAGITCPKHGWGFDIFSGKADRGNYKLKIWEVQVRDVAGSEEKQVFAPIILSTFHRVRLESMTSPTQLPLLTSDRSSPYGAHDHRFRIGAASLCAQTGQSILAKPDLDQLVSLDVVLRPWAVQFVIGLMGK